MNTRILLKNLNKNRHYVVAEIGMNHDGDYKKAKKLIFAAKSAGVDAVKFQFHIPEAETLPNAPRPYYFRSEDRFSYFKRTAFSSKQWRSLKEYSHSLGLNFIVSPFSIEAAEILKSIKVDAYKIASGEVTNLPLLEYIKTTNIPVVTSSGMSSWDELDDVAKILKKNLIVVMQCSSKYPCEPESVGLNIIEEMGQRYKNKIIGFSDHTLENHSSIAAFVKGARVFEKHFTLSKKDYGPDARFSLEPHQMKNYVSGLHFVSRALNARVDKNNLGEYKVMKNTFEKSIVAKRDLPKGYILEKNDLAYKKPGTGIKANQYKKIVGRKLKKPVEKDQMIINKLIL